LGNCRRALVDHGIPYGTRVIVAIVSRPKACAVQALGELIDRFTLEFTVRYLRLDDFVIYAPDRPVSAAQ